MIRIIAAVASCLFATVLPAASRAETIVIIRHAEKPRDGLGQLSCQGLNRALALPSVLRRKFGRPDAIFAPDPAMPKRDGGTLYDYVRPLATIEPAAIVFGLPVDTSLGYADVAGLQSRLQEPGLQNATVVVAWEHKEATILARALLGPAASVPDWPSGDFDAIYVIHLGRGPGEGRSFERQTEGLDGQAVTCPGALQAAGGR